MGFKIQGLSAGVVCGRSRAMARSETGWMACNALVATVLLLSLAHAAHFPPQVMHLGDALEVSDPYAEAFLGETPLGEEEDPSAATDTAAKSTNQETNSETDAATKSTNQETSAATDTATKSTNQETSAATDTKSTDQETSNIKNTDTTTKSTDTAAAKSQTDAADPKNEAEPSTPEQKKLASEQAQVKDAELEWKDAWDSTEAPGKLKLTITPLPNSEDHTWLKQMVENQKPQLLQQDLVTAEDAMKSAQKMMKKRPSEDRLSTAEVLAADMTRVNQVVNQVGKVTSNSTNSTASMDAVVAAATTKDPQVVAAELELKTTKHELDQADDDVAEAKERVMDEAKEEKDRLHEEFATHQQFLEKSKLQKEKAIRQAAQAIAAEKVAGDKSE